MEGREVIQDTQHYFTKGKPHLTNPVALYDGVTTSLDQERATGVVLDFCKELDMNSHNSLLSKLLKTVSSRSVTCCLEKETNPHLATAAFQGVVESDKA
ncbi:hypothetical protein HGM15179_012096 [Zosterops borbonicus]|uniref:Uncharacterized protein n=1 Tax=Zosterops borbonicus TaxID=364589 RepID=A0A8K1GB39_9PASS|nr:hypothetical protein HGM15179_012096 [Zosterops borbonicus]